VKFFSVMVTKLRLIMKALLKLNKRYINEAYILSILEGNGLEVGALSSPFKFGGKVKSMEYADVWSSSEAQKALGNIPIDKLYAGTLIEPNHILRAPEYAFSTIAENKYDFVFSSHVLEHSPNFLFSLSEQIRVCKQGGYIYAVIPHKSFTYDRNRAPTQSDILVTKFLKKDFLVTLEQIEDVVFNTVDHPLYEPKTKEKARAIYENLNGLDHLTVFDNKNTLELLYFAVQNFSVELNYYFLENGNIHFLLKKINSN